MAPLGGLAVLMTAPVRAEAQPVDGQAVFAQHCASCHGATLQGGKSTDGMPAPALVGPTFTKDWTGGGQTAADFYQRISTSMPFGDPGSLPRKQYSAVTAYLLNANGYKVSPSMTEDELDLVKLTKDGR